MSNPHAMGGGHDRALAILAAMVAGPTVEIPPRVVAPSDFQAWFESACHGALKFTRIRSPVRPRGTVRFCRGVSQRADAGLFHGGDAGASPRGVPRRSIHLISPSSRETVAGNAKWVREQFEAVADEGPEALVVIAHSRGACNALAFALENPEFVRDRVHALFLIQGPFGGTGLVDYVLGEGPPMDGRMPWRHRIVARLLARARGVSRFEREPRRPDRAQPIGVEDVLAGDVGTQRRRGPDRRVPGPIT